MKHLMKLSVGVFLLGIVLFSCSKDDDETGQKNYFKVGNTEYSLSVGGIENYGESSDYEGYNLDLTLFSGGITLSADEDGEMTVDGEGHVLYFEMFSSTADAFEEGVYTYDGTEPYSSMSFDYGAYSINAHLESAVSIDIYAGNITISKSGSTYEITIDCTDEDGVAIKGYYKGTLAYYDYSE